MSWVVSWKLHTCFVVWHFAQTMARKWPSPPLERRLTQEAPTFTYRQATTTITVVSDTRQVLMRSDQRGEQYGFSSFAQMTFIIKRQNTLIFLLFLLVQTPIQTVTHCLQPTLLGFDMA